MIVNDLDLPLLRPWLRKLWFTRFQPLLTSCFPQLSDGSTLGDNGERMRIHDAFIVRYDATDKSLSLPAHSDTSSLSIIVSLSDTSSYEGGGT